MAAVETGSGTALWLPVIQSKYLDRESFRRAAGMLRDLIGDYPQVAIGTVCKCKNVSFIEYCCRVAREFFPESWIHAFGLTLTALPRARRYLNSFDSMAWTFPRGRGGHSCRNKVERLRYFRVYAEKVKALAPELRFYTLPPREVEHPFLLCNRKNYRELFRRRFEHAIVDSGVMDFARMGVTDYPPGFLSEWKRTGEKLYRALGGRAWFVIPDYPDDYIPGAIPDNVEKTLANIKLFLGCESKKKREEGVLLTDLLIS